MIKHNGEIEILYDVACCNKMQLLCRLIEYSMKELGIVCHKGTFIDWIVLDRFLPVNRSIMTESKRGSIVLMINVNKIVGGNFVVDKRIRVSYCSSKASTCKFWNFVNMIADSILIDDMMRTKLDNHEFIRNPDSEAFTYASKLTKKGVLRQDEFLDIVSFLTTKMKTFVSCFKDTISLPNTNNSYAYLINHNTFPTVFRAIYAVKAQD